MKIKKIKLNDLKENQAYRLSYPMKPELYDKLRQTFANLPVIIVNDASEIIFGGDYYLHLKNSGQEEAAALQMSITGKDALILNYNLKEKLTGLNLYEKLQFIAKIAPLANPAEIYEKTALDVSINRELLEKLQVLLGDEYQQALINEAVTLKTALKLRGFQDDDRDVLLELFSRVPFSASHQQKILEMSEELIFREKRRLAEIFNDLQIHDYLEKDRPQKEILDALFKFRFPVYMEAEERWQKELASLDLPANVKVTHYPFFEKKRLEVTVELEDEHQFKAFIEKIV